MNNLPAMLKLIAAGDSPPVAIDVEQVTFGGAKLEKHWARGDALKKIQQGNWDYVVLQDHSSMPVKEKESMFKHMRLFDAEIKKTGAKTLLYMTWALQKTPDDQEAITQAYLDIGRELNAKVIPVGIERQNAVKADPTVALFVKDGKHPTPGATYLAACLFYTMLTGHAPPPPGKELITMADPKNSKKRLLTICPKDAEFFQHIAEQTAGRATELAAPQSSKP